MAAPQRLPGPGGPNTQGRAMNTRVRATNTANAIRISRKRFVRTDGQDEQIGRVRAQFTRVRRGCTTLRLGSTHITEIPAARGTHGIPLDEQAQRRQTETQILMAERAAEVMNRGTKTPTGRCIDIQRNLSSNMSMSIQWSERKPILYARSGTKLSLS